MPHTYSLQNVPSHVAAGEIRYRELLASAAEARRFALPCAPARAGRRVAVAALRCAAGIALVRLGVRLQGAAVPGATDTATPATSGIR